VNMISFTPKKSVSPMEGGRGTSVVHKEASVMQCKAQPLRDALKMGRHPKKKNMGPRGLHTQRRKVQEGKEGRLKGTTRVLERRGFAGGMLNRVNQRSTAPSGKI